MERKHTPVYGIKGKLISAVCMLLVAVIMVVSSTYAWFTLSTAPEVTGISTAIGANGALEIRLNGNVNGEKIQNTEWGNLVDLGDAVYGLSTIKLLPATAVFNDDAMLSEGLLTYPKYGSDGRPMYNTDGSLSNRVLSGIYNTDKEAFFSNDGTGVRGLGVAAGMSPRQLAYSNANGEVTDAINKAITQANKTLNNYGDDLGNIIIKKAMDGDEATYTSEEVEQLVNAVESIESVFAEIEYAYESLVIAFAASEASNKAGGSNAAGDFIYNYVKNNFNYSGKTDDNDKTITIGDLITGITVTGIPGEGENTTSVQVKLPMNFTVPDTSEGAEEGATTTISVGQKIVDGYNALQTSKDKAEAAKTALGALSGDVSWTQLSGAISNIADADKIKVNGFTADYIKEHMDEFAQTVLNGGINVVMDPGSGLFTDIADHCGEYDASVVLKDVNANGINLGDVTANMVAKTNKGAATYLAEASTDALWFGEPASESEGALPMTNMYGYVLDLVFKTNAVSSSLLLQVEETDRIYEGNKNAETMGGGSYMHFTSSSNGFGNKEIKELMRAIRIIFFDPSNTNTIYGYAKLDVDAAPLDENGVKAYMVMCDLVPAVAYTYTGTDGEKVIEIYENVTEAFTKYYTEANGAGTEVDVTTGGTLAAVAENPGEFTYTVEGQQPKTVYALERLPGYYKVDTNAGTLAVSPSQKTPDEKDWEADGVVLKDTTYLRPKNDATIIKTMIQNAPYQVSTLVYLEGDPIKGGVTNSTVSATGTESVTGSMNIQFSSSAQLTPMEYGDLHITEAYDVDYGTLPDGVTFNGEKTVGKERAYSFSLTSTDEDATYTVKYQIGSGAEQTLELDDGKYTIPAGVITDKVTIKVTAAAASQP